jgi:flagellin
MIVNHNLPAANSSDSLAVSQGRLAKSLARISAGTQIVDPADDAAGLATGSRLDAELNRIRGARASIGNATSFVQTQEGYLKKIAKALDRMSELSILAQDVTKSDADRDLYNNEYGQLAAYIANAATKDFNGVPLFSATALNVTIDSEGNTFTMGGVDLGAAAYTALAADDLSTIAGAGTALTNVKAAINQLSVDRSSIGAYQTRLNYTAQQLSVSAENLTAAASRIMDVDVAEESTEYAKQNILVQSGTAMLAQANAMPNSVLRLLQQ